MWVLKFICIGLFFYIFWQDYKDRMVFMFLYPVVAVFGLTIQLLQFDWQVVLAASILNIVLVAIIVLVLYLYAKFILQKTFVNGVIGSGDLLFFGAICLIFPTVSFIILFAFSIFTALVLHVLLNRFYKQHNSVPLAGYMALFFALVFLFSILSNSFYLVNY